MDAGHGGGGKVGGVRVLPELASGLHAREAVAKVRFPACKAGGDRCSAVWVVLGQLAHKAADRAAAGCLTFDLHPNVEVEPPVDAGPRVQVAEKVALRADDLVGGDADDSPDEVVTVVEVVVELAAACARACPARPFDVAGAYSLAMTPNHRRFLDWTVQYCSDSFGLISPKQEVQH